MNKGVIALSKSILRLTHVLLYSQRPVVSGWVLLNAFLNVFWFFPQWIDLGLVVLAYVHAQSIQASVSFNTSLVQALVDHVFHILLRATVLIRNFTNSFVSVGHPPDWGCSRVMAPCSVYIFVRFRFLGRYDIFNLVEGVDGQVFQVLLQELPQLYLLQLNFLFLFDDHCSLAVDVFGLFVYLLLQFLNCPLVFFELRVFGSL